MKRVLLITGSVVVSIITIVLCTPLRFYNPMFENLGVSTSIAESRERGVYVFRYKVTVRSVRVNDSVALKFDEAWIERAWGRGVFTNQTNVDYDRRYFLCLVKSGSPDKYPIDHSEENIPSLELNGSYFGYFGDTGTFYEVLMGPPPTCIEIPIVVHPTRNLHNPDTIAIVKLEASDW